MKQHEFYRRHLPHWQPNGAVFFVTFRLKNSLPRDVIEALRKEKEQKKEMIGQARLPDEDHYFEKWDAYLDKMD